MSIWQCINVGTGANVGAPGPLPAELEGWTADALADVAAHVEPCPPQFVGLGFSPLPDPPPPPPQEVTRMQAKQALLAAGMLGNVETAVNAGPQALQIYWTDAPMFHRTHPQLIALATQCGLTSAQVDNLFLRASQIT